uniref:Uncharacterized protein n=1 Tax=Noccaea caerulescens TaxID=107243 RepID=A0A1J3IUK5_NOCCA
MQQQVAVIFLQGSSQELKKSETGWETKRLKINKVSLLMKEQSERKVYLLDLLSLILSFIHLLCCNSEHQKNWVVCLHDFTSKH